MNRYQKLVIFVAAVNILLILLFPPFLDSPITRGTVKSFDGFYFYFMAPPGHAVHADLLTIEIVFVLANTLAAWLMFNCAAARQYRLTMADLGGGIVLFGVANFALISLFPPFEPYSSLARAQVPAFDGFHFLFGDKMHRNIHLPMFYLECVVIAVNLLVIWLMLSLVQRELSGADRELVALAHHLRPDQEEQLIEALRQEISEDDQPRGCR
jgi:hypothetical protein